MNKKVIEISATITCFAALIIFYCLMVTLMVIRSENKKEECIKNGGTVIDTPSVYDSCIYGE